LAEPLVRARAAASSDHPVLIVGEDGVGKTLLSQLIHDTGLRPDAPLALTDCGALGASALRQELLTGDGSWRRALGGTLLLRRIDHLPEELADPVAQHLADLRRSVDRPAGLRLIATATGELADPLVSLLEGIRIELPPLRRRDGDLPLLIQHVAPGTKLSGLALAALLAYPWPGNVSELEGVLAHARTLAGDSPIEVEHLPSRITLAPVEDAATFRLPPGGIDLDQVERELIRQALEMTQGNKSQAARLLGLTRHTLLYRLEKHGFE
jgi:DNA-binding NtrC family response regulator